MNLKKCVIICNPKSGKKNKKLDGTLGIILEKYHYDVDIKYTEYKGHAISLIESLPDDIDLVIAAGGDGTLNEVVTGNLKRRKKLLIAPFPLGTSNDVGTMYGLTKTYVENLENLLNGVEKNIDICLINKQPFVYVACFGKFVDIAYKTPRRLKEKYGSLGYLMYGLKHIGQKIKSYPMEIEIDGVKKEGNYTFIFVTNSTRVAGVTNIYDDVLLDDNQFEVVLCTVKKPKDIISAVFHILNNEIKKASGVEYFKTDNLKITLKEENPYSWCIDGEEFFDNKDCFSFEINKEMNMLVPSSKATTLFRRKK